MQHLQRSSLNPHLLQTSIIRELGNSFMDQPKKIRSTPLDSVNGELQKVNSTPGFGESSSGLKSVGTDNKLSSGSHPKLPYNGPQLPSKGELMVSPNLRSLQESGIERDLSMIHHAIFSGGSPQPMQWDPVRKEFVKNKNITESDSGLNTPKVLSSNNTGKVSPRVAVLPQNSNKSNPPKESEKVQLYLTVGRQSESRIMTEEDSEHQRSNFQTPRANPNRIASNAGVEFQQNRQNQSRMLRLNEEREESGTPEMSKRGSSSFAQGDNSSNWYNNNDSSRGNNNGPALGISSRVTSRMASNFIQDEDDDGY